jgi:hypothetical protein
MRTFCWFALGWMALAGCGVPNAKVTQPLDAEAPPRLWIAPRGGQVLFDPKLAEWEEERIRSDYQFIASRRVGLPATRSRDSQGVRFFSQVFGTEGQDSVLDYLHTRVRAYLPSLEDPEIEERLTFGRESYALMANNLGAALWFYSQSILSRPLRFNLGSQAIPITSPRVGLVEIGSGYWDSRIGPVTRSSTLVHEGRHSDCPRPLTESDRARLEVGQRPEDPTCGNAHSLCPTGHPLEGLAACDAHAWGAYSVEMIYDLALEKDCADCNEAERLEARALALDSASRVLVLQPMLQGNLGVPEMGSAI